LIWLVPGVVFELWMAWRNDPVPVSAVVVTVKVAPRQMSAHSQRHNNLRSHLPSDLLSELNEYFTLYPLFP
jgi:hypothetical protein